ncbi:hypothetical protein [Photobacterium damselae]|uniref:hypothetical protein n=1 Tax=Photobacterium damselae TaxID=38293 RepID=UPI0015A31818|nr:hypothetical protein [Photobacterium damselae]NVO61960.1 hypothetical protein [Photobacterium damselae subsp. damselae]
MNIENFIEKTWNCILLVWEYLSFYVLAMLVLSIGTFVVCRKLLSKVENKQVIALSDKVHSGYGHLFFAMASILWASSVSVFGSDLKIQWFTSSHVSWESLAFTSTVCVAIVIGFLHYIGQQRKEREKHSRPSLLSVQTAASDIIDLNKALHSCLLDWDSIINNLKEVEQEEITAFENNVKKVKMQCMQSMINIAKCWDDSNNEGVIYKANVFNFASSQSVIKAFEKSDIVGPSPDHGGYSFNISAVNQSPFFLFNDNWRSKLERTDYIMVNEQALSVSIPLSVDDKEHSPICMPFSEENPTDGFIKQPNLHGAPTARKKKRTVYLPELLKQVNDKIQELEQSPCYKEYVNENFKTQLLSYYENDSAGSVVSIPIYKYHLGSPFSEKGTIDEPLKDETRITCILNVYATKNYLFANDEMANAYSDLTKPICYVFSILVSLRIALVELKAMLEKSDYTQSDEISCGKGDSDG